MIMYKQALIYDGSMLAKTCDGKQNVEAPPIIVPMGAKANFCVELFDKKTFTKNDLVDYSNNERFRLTIINSYDRFTAVLFATQAVSVVDGMFVIDLSKTRTEQMIQALAERQFGVFYGELQGFKKSADSEPSFVLTFPIAIGNRRDDGALTHPVDQFFVEQDPVATKALDLFKLEYANKIASIEEELSSKLSANALDDYYTKYEADEKFATDKQLSDTAEGVMYTTKQIITNHNADNDAHLARFSEVSTTLNDKIINHIEDKGNPHAVTLAQVGLEKTSEIDGTLHKSVNAKSSKIEKIIWRLPPFTLRYVSEDNYTSFETPLIFVRPTNQLTSEYYGVVEFIEERKKDISQQEFNNDYGNYETFTGMYIFLTKSEGYLNAYLCYSNTPLGTIYSYNEDVEEVEGIANLDKVDGIGFELYDEDIVTALYGTYTSEFATTTHQQAYIVDNGKALEITTAFKDGSKINSAYSTNVYKLTTNPQRYDESEQWYYFDIFKSEPQWFITTYADYPLLLSTPQQGSPYTIPKESFITSGMMIVDVDTIPTYGIVSFGDAAIEWVGDVEDLQIANKRHIIKWIYVHSVKDKSYYDFDSKLILEKVCTLNL